MRRGLTCLLQESLKAEGPRLVGEEVTDFLGRGRYERSGEAGSQGYRNGYTDKTVRTSEGRIRLRRPRVRDCEEPFESGVLARLDALEERLKGMAPDASGYVRGLSTRNIEETPIDEDGKAPRSRSEQRKPAYRAALPGVRGLCKTRPLGEGRRLPLCRWCLRGSAHLHARTGHLVRLGHPLRRHQGTGASLGGRERVLRQLAGVPGIPGGVPLRGDDRPRSSPAALGHPRRLGGLESGHPGELSRVRPPALPTSRDKLRNIAAKLPDAERHEVLAQVKTVYHASDRETAELLAERFVEEHSERYPSAVRCFLDISTAALRTFAIRWPTAATYAARTAMCIAALERAFVEEKRRTKVIPGHMHEKGAMKLVCGVLIRASRKWNRVKITSFELSQLRRIRQLMAPQITNSETISFKLAA